MSFGSGDYVKLFGDFGATDTFDLCPAVRSVTGPCIEESNCDFEQATVCAFDGATAKTKVTFLACMDEEPHGVEALAATKACAPKAGLDYSAIATCFSSDHGAQLLQAASDKWNKQFPSRATVPHTFVNGKDVDPEYNLLKQQLCADGSTASVCSGVVEAAVKTCSA